MIKKTAAILLSVILLLPLSSIAFAVETAETPTIITQPADTTVLVNETATLTVEASVGAGTLSYQWYSNATNSNSGGSLISGATANTYNAPTASAGTTYYYCVVTNTDLDATVSTTSTATTNAAAVIVNEPVDAETPTIDTQPAGTTVLVGEAVTVSVTASVGTGTLSYQWYSNDVDDNTTGALIAGATASSYSAPTASEGTTYYYCIVTNTDLTATGNTTATATTNTAAVIVNSDAETPTIDTQPAGVTVLVNEAATVSVTASVGTGTLSYQWYSNAADSNVGGASIAGATAASYSAPTGSVGTTYYYCIVTNTDLTATGNTTATATTNTAAVIVNAAVNAETPTIDTQPAGTTVLVGEAATVSVTASVGTGTLSYQWYSNAADSNVGGAIIAGATAASYSAPTASEGTTYYYCIVTNTDLTATGNTTATATTNTAAVIVNAAVNAETPTIDTQPAGTTVLVGEAATVSVTASVGTGTLSYQWYSNDVDDNTTGALIAGATAASYSAPTASEGTTYYYCTVTNTDLTATGSTTASATTDTAAVIVNAAVNAETPTIDTQPAGTTVLVGEAATVSVTASVGTGTLSYQWYSNAADSNAGGASIAGATAASYSAPTASAGTTYYYCIVTNTDLTATGNTTATATTDTAAVVVTVSTSTSTTSTTIPRPTYTETPTILTQPIDASVSVGQPVTVSVSASATSGTLSYQWYRNGGAIPGAGSASYAVPTAVAGTAYYFCVVTNTDPSARVTTATVNTRAAEVTVKVAVAMVNELLDTDEDDTAEDPASSDSSMEVDLYDSTVFTQDEINGLVSRNETKPVELRGDGYTMTFPTGTMTATDFEQIDFGAQLSDGSDFPQIAEASGGHPVLIASFNHSGELPGEALITFHVGAEYAGQTLYYYYYNHETGAIEFRQSAIVDSEGDITVTQSSCSDYVLTETWVDEKAGSDVPMEEAIATPVTEETEAATAEGIPETDKGFPWIYFLIGSLLLITIVFIIGIGRRRR